MKKLIVTLLSVALVMTVFCWAIAADADTYTASVAAKVQTVADSPYSTAMSSALSADGKSVTVTVKLSQFTRNITMFSAHLCYDPENVVLASSQTIGTLPSGWENLSKSDGEGDYLISIGDGEGESSLTSASVLQLTVTFTVLSQEKKTGFWMVSSTGTDEDLNDWPASGAYTVIDLPKASETSGTESSESSSETSGSTSAEESEEESEEPLTSYGQEIAGKVAKYSDPAYVTSMTSRLSEDQKQVIVTLKLKNFNPETGVSSLSASLNWDPERLKNASVKTKGGIYNCVSGSLPGSNWTNLTCDPKGTSDARISIGMGDEVSGDQICSSATVITLEFTFAFTGVGEEAGIWLTNVIGTDADFEDSHGNGCYLLVEVPEGVDFSEEESGDESSGEESSSEESGESSEPEESGEPEGSTYEKSIAQKVRSVSNPDYRTSMQATVGADQKTVTLLVTLTGFKASAGISSVSATLQWDTDRLKNTSVKSSAGTYTGLKTSLPGSDWENLAHDDNKGWIAVEMGDSNTGEQVCSSSTSIILELTFTIIGEEKEAGFWLVNVTGCDADFNDHTGQGCYVIAQLPDCERDGHSFTNYVSNGDATCTENGTKTAKCDYCDATDTVVDENSMVPHSFSNYVSNGDATCSKDGTKTAVCDHCDAKDTVTDAGSKLPHEFGEYVSDNNATCAKDGTKTAHCKNCTATDVITDEGTRKEHTWDEGKITKQPTVAEEGITTYTCTVCKTTKEEPIARLDGLLGDVDCNGDVNAKDYIKLKRYVLGTYELTEEQLANSDVNNDKKVNAKDYMQLKRHVLGTFDIYTQTAITK